ncbi:hypothetical protein ABIA32_006430 [Streptacidiphilus sp. MAP12-20]|uniref:(2Fe-2S) ferredoxin domain-containing protein n=1 Tax=Streptacidiphilus sp. MAP12-20 TaxID=3156299 RepID=UPI0035180AAC
MSGAATGPVTVRSPGLPCTLIVCRGCCCGTLGKQRPGTDAPGQLDRLRAAAAASGGRLAVRTSECLGPCRQADVIVVQPSSRGRARGGRPAWVGWAASADCTDDLLAWTAVGGPGLAPPPPALELQLIHAPYRARRRAARMAAGARQ